MEQFTECSCDQCLLMQMQATNAAERQRGWEAWYRRDSSTLQRYIVRRALTLRCAEHSEDIMHDCFLIGFKNVSSGLYRQQGLSLCAYLVGIAKNLLRDVARLQRREAVNLNEFVLDDETFFGVDEAIDLEESVCLQETVNGVREACTLLSHNYQRVVEGIYGEGKSSHELAEEVGKSASNIRAISHRAVREIGDYLVRRHSMKLSTEAIRACLEVL